VNNEEQAETKILTGRKRGRQMVEISAGGFIRVLEMIEASQSTPPFDIARLHL
jgi:hypothetical protein